ncbi:hypothetical protein BRC63_07735 [Halobacteriales archaeon QH_10_70_21]|nr:MAG: hypothetical protein BRC63_07735 [Halobacteriales archaeon QH_10_70_21]
MRPDDRTTGEKVHECFTCGARAEGSAAGTCPACGGELRHLGRSRDL